MKQSEPRAMEPCAWPTRARTEYGLTEW
jgi:hypothetical protein